MVKIELATHAAVLSQQGAKFYIVSPAGNVYATMCVDGSVAYQCITDEDPLRALSPSDNRLNSAEQVAGFEIT